MSYIELQGIHKRLGGKQVLRGVDLTVERGETLVILGASGSGKSVTLRHIVGLMRPDSGRIIVDGEDVTDFSEREFMGVRAKVSFIFQQGALFDSLSVADNVAFGLVEQGRLRRAEIDLRVSEVLGLVGLAGAEGKYPSDLSGGMRKRVALARSLALAPACLLYDEPTAGLDPVTGYKVSELIRDAGRATDVTSVVVTHDIASTWLIADRVALLAEGRIAFIGTVAAARATSEPSLRQMLDAYGAVA